MFSGMFRASPLRTVIEEAAKIGYDAVEIMVGFGANHLDVNCTGEPAREISKVAADNHIGLCLIYTSLGGGILAGDLQRRKDLEELERFLEIGEEMSCRMVKVTAGRLKDSAYKDDEARIVADWLGEACDRAAEHRARIVAEIHFGQYCETVEMAGKIIALTGRPNFGVIHDAGNLFITGDIYGEDSVEALRDRIFHVHIKDMVRAAADDDRAYDYKAGRFKRALLSEGNVDHLPLLRGLKKRGFDGCLSCEASGGDDPVAVARHELAEMKKLMAQI